MIAEALFLRRERLCGVRVARRRGGDSPHERALEVHGEDRDEGRRAEVQDQAFRLWLQVAALSPMVGIGIVFRHAVVVEYHLFRPRWRDTA